MSFCCHRKPPIADAPHRRLCPPPPNVGLWFIRQPGLCTARTAGQRPPDGMKNTKCVAGAWLTCIELLALLVVPHSMISGRTPLQYAIPQKCCARRVQAATYHAVYFPVLYLRRQNDPTTGTMFEHNNLLYSQISAQLEGGTYAVVLDPPTLVCSTKLPWWII